MSDFEQIRFVELLEYPEFKTFLTTKPDIPEVATAGGRKPWRVYVQREAHGKWAKKDFASYVEAFKFMKPHIKASHDVALHCRSVSYMPPGKWVKVVKGGKPVWLTGANDKPRRDPETGKRIQMRRLKPMQMPPGHEWCMYCRRPTIFTWFSKHHSFARRDLVMKMDVERCTICGVSAAGPNDWKGR